MSWASRIYNAFRLRRVNDDIDNELRFHLEQRIEDLVQRGLSRGEAERQARLRFGNPDAVRENGVEVKTAVRVNFLWRDAKFGLRLMAKAPLFTVAVVTALALAIGANTAIFSLLDAVVLRPLPVREPDRLIFLTFAADASNPLGREIDYFNYPLFRELRDAGRDVVDLFCMAYHAPRRVVFDGNQGQTEKLYAQWISGDALPLLGVGAAMGRTLTAGDDRNPGAHPVAVISYSLWDRRFARDPAILGRRVRIDGPEEHSYEIVGVLQQGFTGVEPGVITDIWVPSMMWSARAINDPHSSWFRIWGRLKPGVTARQINTSLQPSFAAFRRTLLDESVESPDRAKRYNIAPLNVRAAANGPSLLRKTYERPLWALMGVVGLLLLVACTTVGSLLLARAAVREREMALRIALGAGRGRLIQQVLVECALLSFAGCVLGCLCALLFAPLLVRVIDSQLYPVGVPIALDQRVLVALLGFGIVTTFLFGMVPAVRASSIDPHASVQRSGGRSVARAGRSRFLLAAQVCCCLVILFFAGLFLKSFGKLTGEDLGFRPAGLFLASVDARNLPAGNAGRAAWRHLRQRIGQLPGVSSASAAAFGLFSGNGWTQNIRVNSETIDSQEVHFLPVAPEFFDTMGISLRAGRDLTDRDLDEAAPRQAIVNAAFAKRYFDERRVLGQRFDRVDRRGSAETFTIIGVVADAKYDSVREAPPPTVYLPFAAAEAGALLIRTDSEVASLGSVLREELPRVHPAFSLVEIHAQARLVSDSLAKDRALALLSALLAVTAITLGGLGLYAVLSYGVDRRTKELGIRFALGASRVGVFGIVVRDSMIEAAIGVAAGLLLGAGLSRFVTPLLFETQPSDAINLVTPAVCVLVSAILCAVPAALRIIRMSPAESLRDE